MSGAAAVKAYEDIFNPAWCDSRWLDHCNLCGEKTAVPKAGFDRYGYAITWTECNRCDLVFLNPQLSSEVYRDFYESGAYRRLVSAYHGREINAETLKPEQRAYADEWGDWLKAYIPPDFYTLLDIGGSTGVVAMALATRFNLRPTVLDPAPAELEEAKKLGCTTVQSEAELLWLSDWHFDLVTLCQAVDHLLDPMSVLRQVRATLQPKGLFFIDPVDYAVTKELKVDHPFNLTEQTMGRYLAATGFDIVAKRRANDGKHIGFLCR